jgi:hypothetical protein
LRDIRVSFAQKSEQVGRIEKRLRKLLAESVDE